MSVIDEIAKPKSNVVRRIYIKRRTLETGLFEPEWFEITKDVIKFGKVKKTIDAKRPYKFKFANLQFQVANTNGRFNPHDDENSLWFGYLNQQRTLVRVDCAFLSIDTQSKPYKVLSEFPETSLWDAELWDGDGAVWDAPGSTVFTGVVAGDIGSNDMNRTKFTVKPLTSVFEDFEFKNLTGFTSTGITASQFVEILRDQTDGGGLFVFRPFFGDTTSTWNYSTTSNIYSQLNTSTSIETIDSNVWQVLEKLAESENFVPYNTGDGQFNFFSRDAVASSSAYEFHGAGSFSKDFGNTIIKIGAFGFRRSKYYSRVQIKYSEADTITSYVSKESAFSVGPASNPWILGDRSLRITNTFFGTATSAQAAADALFDDVSALKNEITFRSSLVLGLDIFDRFSMYYDPTKASSNGLWDLGNWADNTIDDANDLVWDQTDGEQITLNGDEFKFLSFEIDLDNLTNNFIAREV